MTSYGNHKTDIRSTTGWGSVRKVRYASQILLLIRYSVRFEGKLHDPEGIRQMLVEDRVHREEQRLRGAHLAYRKSAKLRTMLMPLAKDNASFAVRCGIFSLRNGTVVPNPSNERILYLWSHDQNTARAKLLQIITNSPYPAYVEFLKRLQALNGEFVVRSLFMRKRDSRLTNTLRKNGFFIDVASFYTIRDLFYDFGLVNWIYEPEKRCEKLFATCMLNNSGARLFNDHIALANGRSLYYNKKITTESFIETFVECYLELARGSWGRWLDVLSLRDLYVDKCRISDYQFNSLISSAIKGKLDIDLRYATGSFAEPRKYGYSIKAISLPMDQNGIQIKFIMMSKK